VKVGIKVSTPPGAISVAVLRETPVKRAGPTGPIPKVMPYKKKRLPEGLLIVILLDGVVSLLKAS
jgi:hypothetical protein